MFYVYLLQSKLKNQIYVGSTKDLRKRLTDHNDGKERSTKRYLPWKLIYYEAYEIEKYAREREMKLKYNGNAMRELKKRIGLVRLSLDSNVTVLDLSSTSLDRKGISKINQDRNVISSKKRLRLSAGAGFTLVELLIVMGVIGVLASSLILIIDPIGQMGKARDAKIKSNVSQLQTALELYRSDCGNYPTSITSGGSLTSSTPTCSGYSGPQIMYLQTIPAFAASPNFTYVPSSGNQIYTITACLEKNDTSDGTISHTACTINSYDRAYRVTSP